LVNNYVTLQYSDFKLTTIYKSLLASTVESFLRLGKFERIALICFLRRGELGQPAGVRGTSLQLAT